MPLELERPKLSAEEERLPHAKYFHKPLAPIPQEKLDIWNGPAADPAAALPCRPFPAEGTGDGFSPVITTIRRALQNSFLFCQNFSNRKGTGSARYCRSTRMGCACPSVSSVSAASNPSVHAAGV